MKRRSSKERYQDMLQKFKEGQARTGKWKKQRGAEKQKGYQGQTTESRREYMRRYRQTPWGKAKEKEKYQRRKRLLDELKAKVGCLSCGESNPRILRFYPRDPQKIKFLPTSQNASRSMRDWLKVIKACDIFCFNCLAKKKAPQKSCRTRRNGREGFQEGQEMMKPSVEMVKLPENPSLTKGREAISENRMLTTCECCEKKFEPKKKKQRFCSGRCRLLFWAAKKILELYRSGQADGLQEIVAELAEVKR